MNILTINCGSSSFKYQLIDMETRSVLCSGLVERIGGAAGDLSHKIHPGTDKARSFSEKRPFPTHASGMVRVMEMIIDPETGVIGSLDAISACGHRVVQGGEVFSESILLDEEAARIIEELAPLAPLHNPPALQGIKVVMELLPDCPSVAVFDTEFHSTMLPQAFLYALPYDLYEKHHVRRYGMHGTSHRYVSRQAAAFMDREVEGFNVITCHLGNGGSITAVKDGKSVDTSMGLTPLAGVIMGTRCGDIDPAIPAYLYRNAGMGLEETDAMLNRESGLKGICGLNDMRDVHAARKKGDKKAQLAFDMLCHSIRKYIGAYFAVLGRVDALVFTAGIGENDDLLRAAVCQGLENFGITLDSEKNATRSGASRNLSPEGTRVPVLVIPTNEEIAIAEATLRVLERTS